MLSFVNTHKMRELLDLNIKVRECCVNRIFLCLPMYVCTCIYVCMYVFMCVCVCVCFSVCVHMCICMCMCICAYVCACVYMCICMYMCVCAQGVVSFEHLGPTREKRDEVLEDTREDDVVQAVVVGVNEGEDVLQLSFCAAAAATSNQAVSLVKTYPCTPAHMRPMHTFGTPGVPGGREGTTSSFQVSVKKPRYASSHYLILFPFLPLCFSLSPTHQMPCA